MEASSVNQPHVDEDPENFEDFFGDGDPAADEPASTGTPAVNAAEDFEADPPDGEASAEPATEPEVPTVEPEPEVSEPEPEPTEPEAVAEPEPEDEKGKKTKPRDYLVFHEVKLTQKVLKALIDEFEVGGDPQPRVAYFVLATETVRTSTEALTAAYTANRDALGEEATLVPLSDKAWSPKHIKPKVKTKVSLDIS